MPRELDRGSVGQVFPLTGHRRLDEPGEKHTDPAEHCESEPDRQEAATVAAALSRGKARIPRTAQDRAADHSNDHDAEQHAHHADIKAHVAVQYVAEFMRNHSLQFLAIQDFERATGDGDRGIPGTEASSKSIDAGFFLQDVDVRNRHAGCDRHFLDHVTKTLPLRIGRVWWHQCATHLLGHLATTTRQPRRLEQAGADDQPECRQRRPGNHAGIRLDASLRHANRDHQCYAGNDQCGRNDVDNDQPACCATCLVLGVEKIHDSASRASAGSGKIDFRYFAFLR